MWLANSHILQLKQATIMDAIEKVQNAIEKVRKNPKYRINRKGLLKLLEARLEQVIYS